MPINIEQLKEERRKVTQEVREKMLGYLVGALGLVAGLAWNDAIRAFIDYAFPVNKDSITMQFVYAIVITCIVVLATLIFTRLLHREAKKDQPH